MTYLGRVLRLVIEMVKPRLYSDADETKGAALWTLRTVLTNALKLLHPFMPFVTEEIFCTLQDEEESIIFQNGPNTARTGIMRRRRRILKSSRRP